MYIAYNPVTIIDLTYEHRNGFNTLKMRHFAGVVGVGGVAGVSVVLEVAVRVTDQRMM